MTTSATILTAATKRLKRRQTTAYFIAFIGIGLIAGVLGPTLPGLAENTASRLNQISVLFTTQALGWLTGSLVSGRWYDRAPAHPLIGGLILLAAAMLALAPLVPVLALLAPAWSAATAPSTWPVAVPSPPPPSPFTSFPASPAFFPTAAALPATT